MSTASHPPSVRPDTSGARPAKAWASFESRSCPIRSRARSARLTQAPEVNSVSIRPRQGPRPVTTSTNPHTQLDQQPDGTAIRDRLAAVAFALPGVREQDSMISVPGARAPWLAEGADGPAEAFMVGSEFAHFHPVPSDQSLHMMLPPEIAQEAIAAGWAELHPVARRGLLPPTAVI